MLQALAFAARAHAAAARQMGPGLAAAAWVRVPAGQTELHRATAFAARARV